jgi:hypothetical protein
VTATPEVCGFGKPDTPNCVDAPATSVRVPKLTLLFGKMDVPVLVMLPEANGAAAVGRTRIFEYVRVFFVCPLLLDVMVNERLLVVTTRGIISPFVIVFMFLLLLSPERVMIGNGAFVSKTNPAGAVRTIVPRLMSPTIVSVITGPVRAV